jgi:AcrR family transcriptional regulator
MPVQERGRRRVDSILDATAALIKEDGLATLSTNSIARRARMPVGTIYQFFPNKSAILVALQERFNNEIDQVLRGLVARDRVGPDSLDDFVDSLAALWNRQNTLVLHWHALRLHERDFAAGDLQATKGILRGNEALLARLGVRGPARRRLMSRLIAESVTAHLDHAVTLSRRGRRQAVLELKRMLHAYVLSATGPSRR